MSRHSKLNFGVAICTFKAQVNHGLQDLHISTAEAGSKGLAEVLGHVGGHVDTHFIGQRGRTHREPERRGERI